MLGGVRLGCATTSIRYEKREFWSSLIMKEGVDVLEGVKRVFVGVQEVLEEGMLGC